MMTAEFETDEHKCAVPELQPGEDWTCPESDCGMKWGQQFAPPIAVGEAADEPITIPQPEIVNVGNLLRDMSDALVETGHAFVPGVPPRDAQAAFYRLGGAFARASKVFGQVGIAMPAEQPR